MTAADDTLLRRAEQLLAADHAHEAEQLARQVLAQTPDSAEACSFLARALLDQGQARAAVGAARSGLTLEPHDFGLRRTLVQALCRVRRADDAREVAESLVEDAPYSWTSHYTLGLAWLGQPYPRARVALASAERAQQLAPASPDPLVLIGMCQSRLGNRSAERAAYRAALALDPAHHFALNNLAAADINRGRLRRGGRSLTSALSVSPRSAIAQKNFGILVAKITVWFFLVALLGLFAVFLLSFQPWYVHASVATAVAATLLLMAWQALRVLPRGIANWGPMVWGRAGFATRARLVIGGLLMVAVLGLGFAPSFHAPSAAGSDTGDRPPQTDTGIQQGQRETEPPVLRLAPVGSLVVIVLLRLAVRGSRGRRSEGDGE